MTISRPTAWNAWSKAAAAWCALFAAVHLYWAVGGSTGLASAAGRDLADRRPGAFVAFGLFGVAAVLLAGVAVIVLASSDVGSAGFQRVARVVMAPIGAGLVLHAVLVEATLATAPSVRASVGPLETKWSLILWNPWFLVGGSLFLAAANHLRHLRQTRRSQ